ncbi:hypothetical protein L6261_01690 [Candidatus Parcubacteria bacterium]|nr:hypothetical protein [Candidatus Parcubacteria bacterium]
MSFMIGEGTVQAPQIKEMPFILALLEDYPGASNATTSGTYDDIDCADME